MARQPDQRAPHDPAITAELLAAFDTIAGNAYLDTTAGQRLPTAWEAVDFAGMHFRATLPQSTMPPVDRGDRLYERREAQSVMTIVPVGSMANGSLLPLTNQAAMAAGHPQTPAICHSRRRRQ